MEDVVINGMKSVQLLDCTLRDGGYLNDWEFGHNGILNVFERVVSSGIDILEVGFIDECRSFNLNRSIFPNTMSIQNTLSVCKARPPILVGMIDYGTCGLEHVQDCKDSVLDGIRVIFKKHLLKEAFEYIDELNKKGYKTFAQLVAVSDYAAEDFQNIIEYANRVEPYAVSMVDTYGLLYPNDVASIFEILNNGLNDNISIGFHAHNNLQLAFANTIAFLQHSGDRNVVVDGTLYGMGKSAGNAPLELLAPYLNECYGKKYTISPMLEAIEENIKAFFAKTPWGYRTQFYLSAENRCHPNYVSYLQTKDNLSTSDINSILSEIEETTDKNKKLFFDKDYVEALYQRYLSKHLDDRINSQKLYTSLTGHKVLLMGPGKNISLQGDKVRSFIEKEHPLIISINYLSKDFHSDYVFLTKKSRYQAITEAIHSQRVKMIVSSNVNPRENVDFIFDKEPLLEREEEIMDNPFLMLLKILQRANIKELYCAGLDGYSDCEDNYFQKDMEYSFVKNYALRLNYHIRDVLATQYRDMAISFITSSHYCEENE